MASSGGARPDPETDGARLRGTVRVWIGPLNAILLALLGLFALYAVAGEVRLPGPLWVHLAIGTVLLADVAAAGEAVDMREMLLSSPEFSSSEARLRRAQELNDLSVRTQLIESKAQLRAATLETEVRRQAVRIFRGSEPVEEVLFDRR